MHIIILNNLAISLVMVIGPRKSTCGHGNRAKKINLTVSCREVTLPGHKTRACAGQSFVSFPDLLLKC